MSIFHPWRTSFFLLSYLTPVLPLPYRRQRTHEEGQVARLALEQQRQQRQAETERLEEVKQIQRQRFQAAELERAAADMARR